MKLVKDKQILVAADFAGLALKDAVVQHLKERGWTVTDVGMKADDTGTPEMYHRIGLRAGAMIAEGEFERFSSAELEWVSILRRASARMSMQPSARRSQPRCAA